MPGCIRPDEKSASWEVFSLVDVKYLQVLPAAWLQLQLYVRSGGSCEEMM